MLKKFITIFVILVTCQSWADTNLLDLLKKGDADYTVSYNCQNFLQTATHSTLKSDALKSLAVKFKNSGYKDNYFFHYTQAKTLYTLLKSDRTDRRAAHKEIVHEGGYSSIMQYQMTNKASLDNVAGVGFYLAANPFSSASYGTIQITFQVSDDAVYLDYVTNESKVTAALTEKYNKHPNFKACGAMLALSLVMDENDIDMVKYNSGDDWVVTFNEDIFTGSKVSRIRDSSASVVISDMISNGDIAALMESTKEFGVASNYNIKFNDILNATGSSELADLVEAIPDWNASLATTFASIIASQQGSDLTNTLAKFKNSQRITESTFFKIPLKDVSADFLNHIMKRIKQNPDILSLWGSNYIENSKVLLVNKLITLPFLLNNAPDKSDTNDIFTDFLSFGGKTRPGYTAETTLEIGNFLVSQRQAYLKTMPLENQYTVFNYLMTYADPLTFSKIITSFDNTGYDTKASFDYALRKGSIYGSNTDAFIISYIKLKKDPTLLTDSVMDKIALSTDDVKLSMLSFLKENDASMKLADTFAAKALPTLESSTVIELTKSPLYLKSLNKEDVKLVVRNILMSPSQDTDYLNSFMQAYNFSDTDLATQLSDLYYSLDKTQADVALTILSKNSALWQSYANLSNRNGISLIFSTPKLSSVSKKFITLYPDLFLQNPIHLAKFPDILLKEVLTKKNIDPYFKALSGLDKLQVTMLIYKYKRPEALGYMNELQFDSQMVSVYFNQLIGSIQNDEDYKILANNIPLVKLLDQTQFSSLIDKVLNTDSKTDLKILTQPDALPLERLIMLMSKLSNRPVEQNLYTLAQRLDFENRSDEDKVKISRALFDISSADSELIALLWSQVFPFAAKHDLIDPLMRSIVSMDTNKQKDFYTYTTSTPANIEKYVQKYMDAKISIGLIHSALLQDDIKITSEILKYVQTHYPIKEKFEYQMLSVLSNKKIFEDTQALLENHIKNFSCKKVNNYHAFRQMLVDYTYDDTRSFIKKQRNHYCGLTGRL